MGFVDLADLRAKRNRPGGVQPIQTVKDNLSLGTGIGTTTWLRGATPGAGATPGNAPGGTICDRNTVGAANMDNPVSGATRYYVAKSMVWSGQSSVQCVVLYDRLWHVRPSLTAGAQAITGAPDRYTGTAAVGNIIFIETVTALAATAHTWSITYTNQDGTTGNVTSVAGRASAGADQFDLPQGYFFVPLLAGDTGVRAITSIDVGTTLASGAVNVVIARPVAWIPTPNSPVSGYAQEIEIDGVVSCLNLSEVEADACLSWFVMPGGGSTSGFRAYHELIASD